MAKNGKSAATSAAAEVVEQANTFEDGYDGGLGQPGDPGMPEEMTLDDLFNIPVDMDEQRKVSESLLLKAGNYTTVPGPSGLTVTTKKVDTVSITVDEDGERLESEVKGRHIIRFFGRAEDKDSRGASLGFAISPVPVYKEGRNGAIRPDSPTKLYNQALKLYKRVYEEDAATVGQLMAFLKENPVKLYVIQTEANEEYEAGNFVTSVSKA